jgi:hypothetical protein
MALVRCAALVLLLLTCLCVALFEVLRTCLCAALVEPFLTCRWVAVLEYAVLLRFAAEAVVDEVVRLLYLASPAVEPLELPVLSLDLDAYP